jgi:hypothetical protein
VNYFVTLLKSIHRIIYTENNLQESYQQVQEFLFLHRHRRVNVNPIINPTSISERFIYATMTHAMAKIIMPIR